jgi:hypothetical protein
MRRTPEKLGNEGSSRCEGRLFQRLNIDQDLMNDPDMNLAERLPGASGGPEDLRRIR